MGPVMMCVMRINEENQLQNMLIMYCIGCNPFHSEKRPYVRRLSSSVCEVLMSEVHPAVGWPDVLDVPPDMFRHSRTPKTSRGYCMSLDIRHAGTWVKNVLGVYGQRHCLDMRCPGT